MKVKKDIFWLNPKKFKESLNSSFLFLLLLFLPSQFAKHFWPSYSLIFGVRSDFLSPTLYFTDIFIISLFLLNYKSFYKSLNKKILTLVFIFVLFNVLNSIAPLISVYRFLRFFELIFLFWQIKQQFNFMKKNAWIPLSIAFFYTSLLAIAQFLTSKTIGGFFYFLGERSFIKADAGIALFEAMGRQYLRAYATLPHPNALAGFLILILLLLYTLKRNIFWYLMPLGAIAIIATFSKSALLALFIALFYVFLQKITKIKRILFIFLIIFVYASLITPYFAKQILDSNFDLPKATTERIRLTESAASMFSSKSIFGVGLGNFIIAEPLYVNRGEVLMQPVHNIILLFFAETGIVGLLIIILILFYFYKKSLNGGEALFLFVFVLTTSFFDHYWVTLPQTSMVLTITTSLVFAKMRHD